MNQDKQTDLLFIVTNNHSIIVFLGYENNTFQRESIYLSDTTPFDIAVGHLDGDAFLDFVVVRGANSTLTICLGFGNGRFSMHSVTRLGLSLGTVVCADLNEMSNAIWIYFGSGNENFSLAGMISTDDIPTSVALSDFNKDSQTDLVVTNLLSNTSSIFLDYADDKFPCQIVLNYWQEQFVAVRQSCVAFSFLSASCKLAKPTIREQSLSVHSVRTERERHDDDRFLFRLIDFKTTKETRERRNVQGWVGFSWMKRRF